jgi:enolase
MNVENTCLSNHDKLTDDLVPKRTSALNVIVPTSVHKQARVAAAQSGMPLKDYIAKLLEHATPIPGTESDDIDR